MNKLKSAMTINRTGAKTAPLETQKSVEGAETYSPLTEGDATVLDAIRVTYADTEDAFGSVPPPASMKQGVSTIAKMIQGKDMTVLIDKLSDRICFEASGTRLYDALISKCQLAESLPPGMDLAKVQHLRDEEHEHYLMLKEVIESLGGDPTALTPAANANATATMGLCKVVTDPRTTVLQALDAMLIAELTDNDGWFLLIDICAALGLTDIAKKFDRALKQEDEHLEYIRSWISQGNLNEAGGDDFGKNPQKAKGKTSSRTAGSTNKKSTAMKKSAAKKTSTQAVKKSAPKKAAAKKSQTSTASKSRTQRTKKSSKTSATGARNKSTAGAKKTATSSSTKKSTAGSKTKKKSGR